MVKVSPGAEENSSRSLFSQVALSNIDPRMRSYAWTAGHYPTRSRLPSSSLIIKWLSWSRNHIQTTLYGE